MKSLLRKLLYVFGLEAISRLIFMDNALKEDGWYLSVKKKQSVDRNNEPIPWLTYPCIDFIKDRLDNTMDLFEYGAGNSSIFYASKVRSVTSIEHSKQWFHIINSNDRFKYSNLDIRLVEAPVDLLKKGYHEMAFTDNVNDYVRSIHSVDKKFDVIVIDGLFRNSCIEESLDSLTDRGVLLLDNTHYKYQRELKRGTDFMKKHGFKRIDFWGMGPIYAAKSCTTIFYKNGNCFNI